MARLIYVKEIKDTHLLRLGIQEGEETSGYTVSARLYSEIGSPMRREAITDEQLIDIKHEDEYFRAKKKALSYLAFSDNNERTLRTKLIGKGFSREVSCDVAREMVTLGYIDERRQLERLVLTEANVRLAGKNKIVPKLMAKGYSSSDIGAVIRELVDSGEIDFRENARKLLEKKLPSDAGTEEKKKLLYKNGYRI